LLLRSAEIKPLLSDLLLRRRSCSLQMRAGYFDEIWGCRRGWVVGGAVGCH